MKAGYNLVNILKRRDTLSLRRALDFLPMFIGTGEEEDIITRKTLISCNGVGNRRAVGVTNVQLGTGIVNRRGNIKRFLTHSLKYSPIIDLHLFDRHRTA